MAENRSFTVLVATFFATFLSFVPALGQNSYPVGSYGGVEVKLYEIPNGNSGIFDYFLVAIPGNGRPENPVIIFNNTYAVMPGPPSRNAVDQLWTSRAHTSATHFDSSLRPSWRFYRCNTPTGECSLTVGVTPPLADLSRLGDISGDGAGNTLLDQAFQDGYAVAVILNGFYRGNDSVSLMVGVRNAIMTLANVPRIDRRRIGLIGRSHGGELAIHPLAFPSDDVHIAATISEAGWSDGRESRRYYFEELARSQPPHLYRGSWDFMVPYINRWVASFGIDPNSSMWELATWNSIASRFRTPILMTHGTDDCMVAVEQSLGLFSALKSHGRVSNKWIYQNGPRPTGTMSVPDCGHGPMDRDWQTKRKVLYGNFFLAKMPPDQNVVRRVPEDVNLLEMFYEFTEEYFREGISEVEKQNVLELFEQAGNPRIEYVSLDPKVPSGRGDQVARVVKDYTFATWRNRNPGSVVRVPEDFNMIEVFYSYADAYFRPGVTPAEQARILGLVNERANPLTVYDSKDPRVPSGRGDVVVPQVVNFVIATFNNRLTTVRIPQDFNMLQVFYSYADVYFRPGVTPAEQTRILGLVNERANPRVLYISRDSRIPTGTGDVVVPQVVNYVVATWQNRPR